MIKNTIFSITLLLFCFLLITGNHLVLGFNNPYNATQLIKKQGYPLEEHQVVTPDGFVLSVQRIPHGKHNSIDRQLNHSNSNPKRHVCFLQHGFVGASVTWVYNLDYESLPFILADAGCDVWLGNSRGNSYSNRNIHYSRSDPRFWQWSWDQMAQYDIPSVVDYIRDTTKVDRVVYIGHSQGTTQAFAQLASSKEFARKLSLFVALAPVTYIKNTGFIIFKALAGLDVDKLLSLIGVHEFYPSLPILKKIMPQVCISHPKICDDYLHEIIHFNQHENQTRSFVFAPNEPDMTSVQDGAHFAQLIRNGGFRAYDYGSAAKNRAHYGQDTPPDYHLDQIHEPPIAVFSGGKDQMADPKDVKHLLAELPSKNVVFHEEIPDYAHVDFTWSLDAHQRVYPKILKLIQQFDAE